MSRYRVPGVAVGILHNGSEHYTCEGITHIHNPLEVTRDTLFQIASNTKTMTGVLAMKLQEEGKLDHNAPVRRYLAGLKLADEETAAEVRVRHLFNHTGGWVGDLFGNTGDGDDALEKYVAGVEKMPQITPLGQEWHYNNAAFGIVGRVVEVLSGKTFEEYTRKTIFEPLGMEKSCFFPHEAIVYRHAVGHYVDEREQLQVSKPWAFARATGPIGRVASSVREMLKYARMHLEGGLGVISAESVKAMQAVTARGQLEDDFGITWWMRDLLDGEGNKVRMILHGGAANGQMSAFWLVPERNFACIILTNSAKGSFLHGELSAWIQEHWLGLRAPPSKPAQLSEPELGAYAGRYREFAFGHTAHLYLQDGALFYKVVPGDNSSVTATPPPPLPPARLEALEKERFNIAEGDARGGKLEVLRSEGEIKWLRLSGRLYARQG
jgi:CubicO group peptidase (beta-lactamase class C family)